MAIRQDRDPVRASERGHPHSLDRLRTGSALSLRERGSAEVAFAGVMERERGEPRPFVTTLRLKIQERIGLL